MARKSQNSWKLIKNGQNIAKNTGSNLHYPRITQNND